MKMRKLNYLPSINNNENAAMVLRLLMSLPLLPACDMETGFYFISVFAKNRMVHLEQLLEYYQRYVLFVVENYKKT